MYRGSEEGWIIFGFICFEMIEREPDGVAVKGRVRKGSANLHSWEARYADIVEKGYCGVGLGGCVERRRTCIRPYGVVVLVRGVRTLGGPVAG